MIELLNMDCMEYMKGCKDNEFDLIIADPPYFETKGEFDYIWSSFDEYLSIVEQWAGEISRILKDSGTLYWWGDDKNIAYTQLILDKKLNLLNSLVWYKKNLSGGMFGSAGGDTVRSYPICTERALVYAKDKLNLTECIYFIRDYIRSEIIKAKGRINLKDINKSLGTATNGGGVASAVLSLKKDAPTMITKDMYIKLQNWCAPYMKKEYEKLRAEYEKLRRPFNNCLNLTEVLIFDQPISGKDKSFHPTPKAPKVIDAIVRTSGKKGGKALIPFMGGGTEVIECFRFGMNTIGIEIDEDYYKAACERFDNETKQKAMDL